MGISQRQLSKMTGIPVTTISSKEYKGMSLNVIMVLSVCKALNWTVNEWEKSAEHIYRTGKWKRKFRPRKKGTIEDNDDF